MQQAINKNNQILKLQHNFTANNYTVRFFTSPKEVKATPIALKLTLISERLTRANALFSF